MPSIKIKNLTVEFEVYGLNSRSLKKTVLRHATGGRIAQGTNDTIRVRAIDNLTLDIEAGDRIGVMGHNGSGKSTLLRAMAGIYKPTSGSVKLEGRVGTLIDPIAGMDINATGVENIYLRGYVLGMTKRHIDKTIDEIIDFSELENFIHFPVKTYSSGMFSRLAFAISSSIESDILLIDEAIGTGDASFQSKIQTRLNNLLERSNILVLASHMPTLMKAVCNKGVFFNSGKMVGPGPIDEIEAAYFESLWAQAAS